MQKEIENVKFKKYEDFWMADIIIEDCKTTFEIHSESLNENLVKKILQRIKDKTIDKLVNDSDSLLKALSILFWGHNNNTYFDFSGLIIDKQDDSKRNDFRICFHCRGLDDFSDYANWIIYIKDFKINGSYRQQL